MLASIPPWEQIVPIVGIIATNNGRTCQEQRGCSLDGTLIRLLEDYTPKHHNSHNCALYHHNHRNVIADIVAKDHN